MERLRPDAIVERLPVKRGVRAANTQRFIVRVQLHFAGAPNGVPPCTRSGRKAAIVQLPSNVAGNDPESLKTECLKVLARLRTDCLLTLYALISIAEENDGRVFDHVPTIASIRGWDPSALDARSRPGAQTRRERLREHLQLLTQVEFVFTVKRDGEVRYAAYPMLRLFAHGGKEIDGRRKTERAIYEFHPYLWKDMKRTGRAFFYDRAVLTADAGNDEWSVRLLWHMSARWAPSWVSKQLDRNGGRLTERLGVMLKGAGIEYGSQLRAQGRPWLRARFCKALDRLLHWASGPLIGGYQIDQHKTDPLEDRVTFWPTPAVAARLSASRSKAIEYRDRNIHARRSRQAKTGVANER